MKLLKNVLIVLAIIVALLILFSGSIFAKTVVVDTDTLKLRKEATTDSATLELLNIGEKLEYIDESGDWYKVKVRGITGYVHKDYTKLEQDEKEIEQNTNSEANSETEGNIEKNNIIENTTVEENNTTENNKLQQDNTSTEEIPVATEPMKVKILRDTNIYILPLINANIIQNIKKDAHVTIISKTNGWAYVETDEVMGWIRQEALTNSEVLPNGNNNPEPTDDNEDTTTTDTEITAKTMYVKGSSVYVRKGPSTDTEVIDSLILNNAVKVIAENGDWYKVEVTGKTGYIVKRLLSDTTTKTTSRGDNKREEQVVENIDNVTTSSKGEQIVEYAKKYLGCKYVYGASGPSTFDCSGFTMYVLKQFGVSLSHSATAQSKVGTYVAKENLQPGDLVFFTDYETDEGIGHCGIYIGNGDFIHASSGAGYCVKVSTLLSGSYLNRYETARRVV